MYSVRRAALRAASCSSRVVAVPRQQVSSFAVYVSKANLRPAATLPLSRYFSKTARAAQEQRDDAAEEAMGSAENDNSIQSEQHMGSVENDNAIHPQQQSDMQFDYQSENQSDFKSDIQSENAATPDPTSIFISNMTFDATDMHLREAFSQYGEIESINIGRDGRGLSRGFGFITFKDKEAARKAVEQADKSFWHGRRINVQHRKSTSDGRGGSQRQPSSSNSEPSLSIYIGNIPYETSDADLNALFRSLDNVIDVRVAVDRNTGWPRGFAHADFADLNSAINAFKKLTEMTIGGRQLRVDYTQPKRPSYQRSNSNSGNSGNRFQRN